MNKRIAHNIFEGINPVLNEKLLYEGRWQDFHNSYLVHLRDALKRALITKGYHIGLEESVQIQRLGDDNKSYRPDLIISQRYLSAHTSATTLTAPATQTFLFEEVFDEADTEMTAIVIRKRDDAQPVTWIELLSPTNKSPYRNFAEYLSKRTGVYTAGVSFIELDFIHTQPPALSRIADYSSQAVNASPFYIGVFEPRPSVKKGQIFVYNFGVADKIPTIPIPLAGEETYIFDFNAPYQKMFDDALYGLEIDYTTDSYHHYHLADRDYILKRIASALADDASST
ncbi:MAG: DUF4058 family protein [bacterium]|nr:DUF4058 family protein [bacterium]